MLLLMSMNTRSSFIAFATTAFSLFALTGCSGSGAVGDDPSASEGALVDTEAYAKYALVSGPVVEGDEAVELRKTLNAVAAASNGKPKRSMTGADFAGIVDSGDYFGDMGLGCGTNGTKTYCELTWGVALISNVTNGDGARFRQEAPDTTARFKWS